MSENKEWNVLKGLGIFLVVYGHTKGWDHQYTYQFHMAFFFFLSGYFYNVTKYEKKPFLFIASRLKSYWWKFVMIEVFFLVLHNLVIVNLDGESPYSLREMGEHFLHIFFFSHAEAMCGALWFVPVLFYAQCVFAFVLFASEKVKETCKIPRSLTELLGFSFFGAAGYLFCQAGEASFSNIHLAFLVSPFLWAGYIARQHPEFFRRIRTWYVAIPCFVLIYFVNLKYGCSYISNVVPPTVYLTGIAGTIGCFWIVKFLTKSETISGWFGIMGHYSFSIMAWNIFLMKIVDVAYAALTGTLADEIYRCYYPVYPALWPFHLLVPILIPILVCRIYEKRRGIQWCQN